MIQPIGEYGILPREKRQPISGVEVGALPAGSVAGLPPIVQGAGGLVRLADLFYDILVLDEENDAHRPVASFDRLRTGLGQVRGSTSRFRVLHLMITVMAGGVAKVIVMSIPDLPVTVQKGQEQGPNNQHKSTDIGNPSLDTVHMNRGLRCR